ncbi:GAF domain-containing protein [Streptomyces sp. NPDC002221]|uniref:GAF domain-containing protein n=1 Tax=Streptomyces sp. NPDC002221 TaxID=3364639 RepID=UPI0036A02642
MNARTPDSSHLEPAEHAALLRAFGLNGPEPELDAFAAQLAKEADVPYAMINIFGSAQQFFGLHTPQGDSEWPTIGRSMPLEHGFCPEVVARRKALVLPDVFSHPRFAGNPVIDQIGIRTYAGAPLIHDGSVLGTVCFVGPVERDLSTGRESLALIKQRADDVMTFLCRRSGLRP